MGFLIVSPFFAVGVSMQIFGEAFSDESQI